MNILFLAARSLSAICLAALNASAGQSEAVSSSQTEWVSTLACNAFALSPEVRKRHFEELGPALLKLKKSTRELPDGYEFELPADNKTYQLLTEWAIQERLCCPFFGIDLRFDREGGPLWLRLTGRPGTKEFIKEEWESAQSRRSAVPQISTQEFEQLPLRVHSFLAGVPLHDVWSVDLPRWRAGVTLDDFLRTASNRKFDTCGCSKSSSLFTPFPLVRVLLDIRFFVGRFLG